MVIMTIKEIHCCPVITNIVFQYLANKIGHLVFAGTNPSNIQARTGTIIAF
jgi:hypothetical protein